MKKQTLKEFWIEASQKAECLGHSLYFNCDSHAFAGRVIDVEMDTYLVLEKAKWVFETGKLDANKWDMAEALPSDYVRVAIAKIESWGDLHRPL